MVDPNRKINRLVDRDVNFLESCEQEFAGRFTDDDPEFMAHCSKPLPEPPIVENWMGGGGGGGSGGGFAGGGGGGGHHPYNRYNGHRRGGGDRGWQRRGGAGYHNNQDRGFRDNRRHNRYDPRERRDRDRYEGGRESGPGFGGQKRSHDHNPRSDPPNNEPPMKVRRDYGNFVPASKD
ncbi:rRNA 2'-O-methyltransferase fibrillarin [Drosophila gunungcola]|uniref:rRNA 2'-O-methyltransferase fibrillarin n=1 Tax=Drosophila gunungcola TaxID=103775 RepID=UPI0022DFBAC9|nr:rRNA 2'-O-methyltransferase fibrillarin [Drosophila gunungcola]